MIIMPQDYLEEDNRNRISNYKPQKNLIYLWFAQQREVVMKMSYKNRTYISKSKQVIRKVGI